MALAFRASASANASAATSITISVPAGTANGDILLMGIALAGTTTITTPAGWSVVATADNHGNADGNGGYARAFSRVASSEPASYTVSFSGSSTAAGAIRGYTGGNTTTPTDGSNSTAAGIAVTTLTAPSVTTTVDGDMIVCFLADLFGGTPSVNSPLTHASTGEGGGSVGFVSGDWAQSAHGATGTFTATDAGGPSDAMTITVALQPAGAPSTLPQWLNDWPQRFMEWET